jgi:voltage-gated potassium channel
VTEAAESLRRAAWAGVLFLVVLAAGTIAFVVVDDERLFEAFYRTVITVSTAGLVAAPVGTAARVLTAVLVVGGVAIFLYVFGLLIELTVSGTVTGALQERRLRRRVEGLDGHYVVAGYGRMGRRVAGEFRAAGVPYVVMDVDPARAAEAREEGHLALAGSASEDGDLAAAGLERAQGLVACAGDDADNVYVILTARQLRPNLMIVARASDEEATKKLARAGADRVVSPYATAGKEMARLMLRPQVAAFLDVFAAGDRPTFRLEEIELPEGCDQIGRSIRELNIRETTGAMIIAHRREGGSFDTRPDPDTPLAARDVLIGVGSPDEIQALEDLFRPRAPVAG